MPLPATANAWKNLKTLIKQFGDIIIPAGAYLYELLDDDAEQADIAWMRLNLRYSRATPTGTSEDMAQFKVDVVNITGGAIDSTWTAGDFTAVEGALDTFTTALAARIESGHVLKEYRAYRMMFNPDDPGVGNRSKTNGFAYSQSGPPVWVKAKNVPGAFAPAMPYQTACAVTLKTGWPRHWGRCYIPGVAIGLDTYGRFGATGRQAIANAFFDLNDDLTGAGFLPVVPITQVHNVAFHGLLGVNQFVVDDIPDVIRRRRPKQAVSYAVGVE